jgi:hypothetical protein
MAEADLVPGIVRQIPAPGGPIDVATVQDAVHDWVTNPAFTALVAAYDGPPVQADLSVYLEALERFSVVWDFRAGKERNFARAAEVRHEREGQILDAARILGLRGGFSRPGAGEYDHCLILGGMIGACMTRPAWAAELVRTGVRFGDVTALGGFRRISGDEPVIATEAGLGDVTDEFHAMDAGLRCAFAVVGDPAVDGRYDPADPNRSWAVHRFRVDDLPLSVVAAPSTEPQTRRANTADSYAWWAKSIASLAAGHRILLVTSSIYVPFQHADAVRMLAAIYGCAVETVGVPEQWTAGMPRQQFSASNYLQEFRSAIRSMRMLVESVRHV